MLLRGASCMPMLRLLVTTVRRRRPAIARATASVVVPPVRPTSESSCTSLAAASAIRRFSAGCWEARSPIGCSTKPPGRPTRPHERATAPCCSSALVSRRIVAGATDELVGEPLDGHRALRRLDDLDDRAQALVAAVAVGLTQALFTVT